MFFKRNFELVYLLLQYDAGHWDFVKGNVECGETEQETAIRELKEETGIVDARFVDGFRQPISYFYKRKGNLVHKEVIFFLMETKAMQVKLSFEHVDFAWLPYDQAIAQLTFANARNVLQKAHTFVKK